MASNIMPNPSLPADVKAVIWRIFGAGESPMKRSSTYELIELVIKKYVPSTDPHRVASEIRGWFESHGDQRWLKSEMRETVAVLILEGIGTERSETAIWAVGSIEADLAARIICSFWSVGEIDSFVECTLKTLAKLCDRDEVLDPTHIAGLDSTSAKIPKSAVKRQGRLETFRHLDLVLRGLHHGAQNLIDLMVDLRPEIYASLIKKLDHPVMQIRAAQRMIYTARRLDHRESLQWIGKKSSDALIALGLVHTLNTVNKLDEELRYLDRTGDTQHIFSTELRPPQDDLDTAAGALLTGLVDRLALLDPLACVRWVGELLSGAPYMLVHGGKSEIPHRIRQLETACTKLLARLVCQSWSDDLLAELRAGLCLTPRKTWTRHMAEIAWEIRETDPVRAAQIARATLKEHERYVTEEVGRNRLFLNWSDWHQRDWFTGLGIALVLSHEELDLPKWVSAQCQALPLSVWDIEENHEAFCTADRAVQHWFLVVLHAIPPLIELGRKIDPSDVRTLAEMLWTHYEFTGQYLPRNFEALVVVEHAARSAAEYGKPSDVWLLDQARFPGVGPRALWALIDQRNLKNTRGDRTDARYDKIITDEFFSIASDRYHTDGPFDLEALCYWGQLWLLLDAVNEAEQTAMAIIAFPLKEHSRADKILVLKLLALVVSKRKLASAIRDYPALFYSQLWYSYTPSEEREDRQQIDEKLK